MKKRLFRFLVYRYQQGTASRKEQELFNQWYASLDNESSLPSADERAERSLQQIFQKIGLEDDLVNKSTSTIIYKWLSVAVALLLFAAGGMYWYTKQVAIHETELAEVSSYRIFETQIGERKQVTLPDGSMVVLNARSSLRIDTREYGKANRRVELLCGEAFFDVKKDSSRAFVVLTGALQTRVLGTSFNIQAYNEVTEQVISVFSGRVQVQRGEHTLGILSKGEQIRFDKTQANSATENFDVNSGKEWMTGRVFLKQASFNELALAIKNNYGIILKAGSERIARQQYSLPIHAQVPFEDALTAICSIHKDQSRKEGDTVLIY